MGATGSMNSMYGVYASMGTSAMSSIGTSYAQSNAIKAQGDYQESLSRVNAKIADLEGKQTLEAGDAAASRKNLETTGVVGEERAAAGASGTDVNTGSNALIQSGTAGVGKLDELTIRNNAARQAWGFKVQAIEDTYKGEASRMTATSQSQQTLLTGGIQSVSGPLGIYSNYLRWSRGMGGGGSTEAPYDMRT